MLFWDSFVTFIHTVSKNQFVPYGTSQEKIFWTKQICITTLRQNLVAWKDAGFPGKGKAAQGDCHMYARVNADLGRQAALPASSTGGQLPGVDCAQLNLCLTLQRQPVQIKGLWAMIKHRWKSNCGGDSEWEQAEWGGECEEVQTDQETCRCHDGKRDLTSAT